MKFGRKSTFRAAMRLAMATSMVSLSAVQLPPALADDTPGDTLKTEATAHTPRTGTSNSKQPAVTKKPVKKKVRRNYDQKPIDRTGQQRHGHASYYGKEFNGRKMADGKPFNPHSNVAASRTLPIGTKVRVTNLENGKSEVVEIRDRGPYIEGRIIDLTQKTAEKLGMLNDGVAPVVVAPIEVPQANGGVKAGAGAVTTSAGSSGNAGAQLAGND